MREIKFRAWEDGKMEYDPCIWGSHELGECWMNKSIADSAKEGVVFMQYTGLKDRTKWDDLTGQEQFKWLESGKKEYEWAGKEIYEGDIFNSKYGAGEIKYMEGSFWAEALMLCCENDELEIIGNIYENKELVK